MKRIISRYAALKSHKPFYWQLALGVLLFGISLLFNYAANGYTATHISGAVSDIFLDNLPVMNVDWIFFESAIVLSAFIIALGLYKPNRLPFMLKSVALFIAIRSFFMILTHLAPPLGAATVPSGNILERLAAGSGKDLFFSGHTGVPFLMALLFWHNKYLRMVFLLAALFFGVAVLLGHLHYSIDVFSAFFITYGIFHLSRWLFKKDYEFFMRTID